MTSDQADILISAVAELYYLGSAALLALLFCVGLLAMMLGYSVGRG